MRNEEQRPEQYTAGTYLIRAKLYRPSQDWNKNVPGPYNLESSSIALPPISGTFEDFNKNRGNRTVRGSVMQAQRVWERARPQLLRYLERISRKYRETTPLAGGSAGRGDGIYGVELGDITMDDLGNLNPQDRGTVIQDDFRPENIWHCTDCRAGRRRMPLITVNIVTDEGAPTRLTGAEAIRNNFTLYPRLSSSLTI